MELKRAIVRKPSKKFYSCISSHPEIDKLNLENALRQHKQYVSLFQELGLDIIELQPNPNFADSCFVEDNVIIHHNKALITRMGAESRRGEVSDIHRYLSDYLQIEEMTEPATIEGGDVIHVFEENYLISGITQRTNHKGIEQLKEKLKVKVKPIEDKSIIHLKSHVTYLDKQRFIVSSNYANHPVLEGYSIFILPDEELYAGNTLTINGNVIIPSDHPKTKNYLESEGYDVHELEISEFAICEGALTCLSILF